MTLDFLFATPADFYSHLQSGMSLEEIALAYGVPLSTIEGLDFFKTAKKEGGFRAKPAKSFAEPVSVMDLRKGMCATVVDGDFDLPHYCGAPVTNERFRLCSDHKIGFFSLQPKGIKDVLRKKGRKKLTGPQLRGVGFK